MFCLYNQLTYFFFFFLQCLQGHARVNFVSTLLRVTMTDQLDLPVRQAGESELSQQTNNYTVVGFKKTKQQPKKKTTNPTFLLIIIVNRSCFL